MKRTQDSNEKNCFDTAILHHTSKMQRGKVLIKSDTFNDCIKEHQQMIESTGDKHTT